MAAGQHTFQGWLASLYPERSLRPKGAYPVMKLGLNGSQVWEDVCVVEFEIVQNGDFGAVVQKL